MNTAHYVLDPITLKPVETGCIGELFIGGKQVARGYLNREELTNSVFTPNPFRLGERVYKTGDLARMHSNGHVQILGRADRQVKIRGIR